MSGDSTYNLGHLRTQQQKPWYWSRAAML